MIHHYLFFIRDNEVEVFRHKRHKTIQCNRNGLSVFPFGGWDELWDWWRSMSGITSKDTIDFVFVSDSSITPQPPFSAQKTSCWSRQVLESFFTEFCSASQIDLIWENGSKIRIKDTPPARLPEKVRELSFFIFPPLNEIEISSGCDEPKGQNALYKHFRDEMEKNRQRNQEK